MLYNPEVDGPIKEGQLTQLDPNDPISYMNYSHFPQPLPLDKLIALNEIQTKLGMGLESKEGALRTLGEEFPEEKLEEIRQELISDAEADGALQLVKIQIQKQIMELIELRSVRNMAFSNAEPIGKKVIALFEAGEFDVCTLFYSRFRSVIAQIPTATQLIPARLVAEAATGGAAVDYDYEPDEVEILTALLPRNISVQVFRALLENAASEQGARMSAMDNATRNAGDMIRKQTQIYNRSRQAMITKELIEIISGAEAL
jgi:ATP synthase F1 gamma subunit